MGSVTSLGEHLVEQLHDLLNADEQLIEALPQMAERASTTVIFRQAQDERNTRRRERSW